jgi:quercetin dioxygenase-like cupin family protein
VYLVKGRMQLVIDGQAFVAQAGDAWLHPQGVRHWSETLEECVAIEIKSPPRKTWG